MKEHPARTVLAATALVALLVAPLAAAAPDRSSPPEPGPPPSLELPAVERFELANGLTIYLMEKHQVPLVELRLLVRSGAVDDPREKSGLASMTAEMLDEGAGGRDALALAEEIDYLGADLSTWSSPHISGVRLFTPLAQLEAVLGIMADVVLRPGFPPAELERLRAEELTALLQARDEPRAIATVAFDQLLFGIDHPYGRHPGEADLKALTVADLRDFHRRHFRPDNAALVVVGDVTRSAVTPILESSLGKWKGVGAATAQVPVPAQIEGRRVALVDKPGAAQSEIRIGRVGTTRDTADYYPLTVMNTVLGGSFTSRLNSNLREDKGYTYGARSRFDLRPVPGPFVAGAAVQTDKTAAAVTEFMKELKGIADISDEEVVRGRNYRALRYPGAFQTVGGIAGELTELVIHGLPLDTFNHHVGRLMAVDREAAMAAGDKYVDPENLLILVVGDRATVEEPLKALELGKLEVHTVEDVLGPAPTIE